MISSKLLLAAVSLLIAIAPLHAESGVASFYGGGHTASGEVSGPREFTAAHRTLPFGTLVRVTNTGARSGIEVPQAYLTDPAAAGEPPARLVAFTTVALAPGHSARVSMDIPASAFQAYLGTSWTTVPGTYTVSVGDSSSSLGLSVPVVAS